MSMPAIPSRPHAMMRRHVDAVSEGRMIEGFDDVDLDRLRARRTVKWTLHGPEVLAAWVAEMDFDVAPVVRRGLLDAVDREDFGYVEAVLGALTAAAASFFAARYGWAVA